MDDPTPDMTPLSDAALELLDRGWHPIPLPRGSKQLATAGVTGYKGRDYTADEAGTWLGTVPGTNNLATRCPEGCVGIDIDVRPDGSKNGIAKLHMFALDRDLGPLPDTFRSSARTGPSSIRWYRLPSARDLKIDPELDVDLIQRHHRYGVLPPSLHPTLGTRYRWWKGPLGLTEHADGPPLTDDLAGLPGEWVEALTPPPPPPPRPYVRLSPNRTSSHTGAPIDDRLDNYRQAGSKHPAMHAAVCAIVRLDSFGVEGAQTALDWLRNAYVNDVGNRRGSNGHVVADREFCRSVKDACALVGHGTPGEWGAA